MKKVSVIIPTYKRVNLLAEIFDSLLNQSLVHEVIVIDSDSNDGTEELVFSYDNSQSINFKYINVENSVALKRNTGVYNASQEFLIFIDDDCVPNKNFVKEHVDCLLNKKNTVNCGDVFFPESEVKASNYLRYKNSRHKPYLFSQNGPKDLDYRSIVTMNMSIRKSDILKYELFFDEGFIGYGMEDNEFGYRVSESGMKIQNCAASIQHMESNDPLIFAKKIFHTSRDGVNRLKSINKAAVMGLRYSFFFEPDFKHPNLLSKLTIRFFTMLFSITVAKYILYMLNLTDRARLLYFPALYQYVFACYYFHGVKNRSKAYKNISDVKSNWFSSSS